MKTRKILTLWALCLLPLVACEPPDEIEPQEQIKLELNKSLLDFTAQGGEGDVSVTCTKGWDAEVDRPWCHLEKKSTGLLRVVVEASDERLVRECNVTVKAGDQSRSFIVRQLGYEPAILLDASTFDVHALGGEVAFHVTANVQVSGSPSHSWITKAPETKAPEMVTTAHRYVVQANVEAQARTATITFVEDTPQGAGADFRPQSAQVHISQGGLGTYEPVPTEDLTGDVKLKIARATTSSQQSGSGNVEQAFDGDYSTLWHSNWSNGGANYFPITVTFFLEQAAEINHFIYHPRTSHTNGNFKEVDIETSLDGNTFTPALSYDFGGVGTPTKVVFDAPVKALAVKFTVRSGAGDGQGFASCAEMEFFAKSPEAFRYQDLFADETCAELKDGITEAEIQACSHAFFKNLALYMYRDAYQREFRVASFKPYPNPDIQSRTHKTNAYSRLDNPTGISVKEGEDLIVLAGDLHGQTVSLFVQNLDRPENNGFMNGSWYSLSRGLNQFSMRNKGLVYVMYHTQTLEAAETLPPIRLHFASGKVNGYYNNEDPQHKGRWTELLAAATDKYFDVLGKYAHMTFETQDFRTHAAQKGPQLAELYDNVVLGQMEFLGLAHYNKLFRNRSYLNVMYHSYMNATSYRTSYHQSTMSTVCNPDKARASIWGPAHEIGHTNQTGRGLNWIGCTEVTNNITSLYSQTVTCKMPSRVQEEDMGNLHRNRYGKAWNEIYIRDVPHSTGSDDVFARLIPFWQLQLYFGKVLGQSPELLADKGGFYPQVYEYVRTNPVYNNISDGDAQLEFVYACCVAARTNLLDFFDHWGFLTPVDVDVEDYSTRRLTVTQAKADKIRSRVEALGYPKPALALQYISDNTVELYKNPASVIPSSDPDDAMLQGTQFVILDWKNVVAYELVDVNGTVLYLGSGENTPSDKDWFDPKLPWMEGHKLYALSCTGERTLVPLKVK